MLAYSNVPIALIFGVHQLVDQLESLSSGLIGEALLEIVIKIILRLEPVEIRLKLQNLFAHFLGYLHMSLIEVNDALHDFLFIF